MTRITKSFLEHIYSLHISNEFKQKICGKTRKEKQIMKETRIKITPELKTALVLAAVTNSWTLGYCWDKKIISDKEMDLIIAAREKLQRGGENYE
jgi:hypothetical protein